MYRYVENTKSKWSYPFPNSYSHVTVMCHVTHFNTCTRAVNMSLQHGRKFSHNGQISEW